MSIEFTSKLAARAKRFAAVAILGMFIAGCRQDMHDQPKYKPLRASSFFQDGSSARPLVAGTIPQGSVRNDEWLYTGKINGALADAFPFPVTRQVLERGRQRFQIFCSPCHGRLGNGEGMVVKRGFRQPPSYHIDRLRQAPAGHFFDVITNGYGAMPDYAARVAPRDRWAIAAYIRALQLSQNATMADVPESERSQLLILKNSGVNPAHGTAPSGRGSVGAHKYRAPVSEPRPEGADLASDQAKSPNRFSPNQLPETRK